MDSAIPLPAPTIARLRQLIEQRNQLNEKIELVVTTAREAQNVPEKYILNNIDIGWQAPPNA